MTFKPTVLRVLVRHGARHMGRRQRSRRRRAGPYATRAKLVTVDRCGQQHGPPAGHTRHVDRRAGAADDEQHQRHVELHLAARLVLGNGVLSGRDPGAASFGATALFAGYSERVVKGTLSVTYENRRRLQFRYIRVNWNGMGAPTDAVCVDTLAAAVPLLPTPSAGIAPVPGQGVHNRSATAAGEDGERRNMLNDFEDEHNCSCGESGVRISRMGLSRRLWRRSGC